jgi:hypothetical protein
MEMSKNTSFVEVKLRTDTVAAVWERNFPHHWQAGFGEVSLDEISLHGLARC